VVLTEGTYTSVSAGGNSTLTFSPGNYIITGDLDISGNASVTFGAGVYTIGGNLNLSGGGTATGSGVTFLVVGISSTISVDGSGGMTLSAPTSGTYNGILFAQSSRQGMSLTGNASTSIAGIIYGPASALTVTGSGTMSDALDIVVDSMTVTGSGSVTITNYAALDNPGTGLGKLVMVE
jgi:hypothetical protein